MRKYVNPAYYFETYYSNTIALFKIIGRVNIFLFYFNIFGAILLIFHILLGLKLKQNGAWKTKKKKENFYSFASMESANLFRLENVSFLAYTDFSEEL